MWDHRTNTNINELYKKFKPITFDEGIALAKEISAASYVECTSLHVVVYHGNYSFRGGH